MQLHRSTASFSAAWACLAAAAVGILLAGPAASGFGQSNIRGQLGTSPAGPFHVSGPLFGQNSWISGTWGNEGLGFDNSYGTFGTRIGPDFGLFSEVRLHLSEEGNFFSNVGVGHRAFVTPLNLAATASFWYDYDGDQFEPFGHDFHQVGVNANLQHEQFGVNFNGYQPIGQQNHTFAPDGSCFIGNRILVQQGIDSALRGWDLTFQYRMPLYEGYHAMLEFGGYQYASRLVDEFEGFKIAIGGMPIDGLMIRGEINDDDTFGTTGLVTFAWLFGAGRMNAPHGRGFEMTRRNDHIVRFNQEPIFATNPATGALYNVIHVDNTAAPGGTGRFDSRFDELADADPLQGGASSPDDLIFVWEGDGTTAGYDTGITLQDGQRLFGDGVAHVIPTLEVGDFMLCNNVDGNLPMLENIGGGMVVVTAADTEVAGLNILSTTSGVSGSGYVGDTLVRDNVITGGSSPSIDLTGITGDVMTARNDITGGADGIEITGITGDVTSTEDVVTGVIGSGIDVAGVTGTVTVDSATVTGASVDGVTVANSDTVVVTDSTLTGNGAAGVRVVVDDGIPSTAMITGNTTTGNLDGVAIDADGVGSDITATVTNSAANAADISNNTGEGVLATVTNGGSVDLTVDSVDTINTNTGSGITLVGDGGSFILTATGNTLDSNDGGGFAAVLTGATSVDATISGNTILGTTAAAGDGVNYSLDVTTTTNIVRLTGNTFESLVDNGVVFVTANDAARLDVVTSGNTVEMSGLAGFSLTTTDASRVRLSMAGDTFDLNDQGIVLNSQDSSRILALAVNNVTVTQSTNEGLALISADDSIAILEVNGGNFSNNGAEGLNVSMTGPTTAGVNHQTYVDLGNVLINGNGGVADVLVAVDASADEAGASTNLLCLELSGVGTTNGIDLQNNGGAGVDFFLEDDLTSLQTPTTTGIVTPVVAGSCDLLITGGGLTTFP